MSTREKLTTLANRFLQPSNSTHRQYEALRAYFVDGLSSADVAARFGYTPGSLRGLVHQFRQDPDRPFFVPAAKGPHSAPKRQRAQERVIALRKQNFSIYDIRDALRLEGQTLSPGTIQHILRTAGFARLPRRGDDERPPGSRPTLADVADVALLNLEPRSLTTKFGGLFLFLPVLAALPLERILRRADFPGSAMVPAAHAVRSLLALKLF